MAECTGLGECFDQCICTCYDQDCGKLVCFCGHASHKKTIGGKGIYDVYCKEECPYNCKLVECSNYKLCNTKMPQILINIYKGMCSECNMHIYKWRR